MIYPWQTDDWTRLEQLRASWPHALLLHGRAGIGKLQFAQHLAQSLLCESPTGTREPCGKCVACLWFSQGNHPDYRAVLPEALAGELINDDKADKADEDGKKTKVLSKEIKIDQVLGLMNFFSLGSHRGGARVGVTQQVLRPLRAGDVHGPPDRAPPGNSMPILIGAAMIAAAILLSTLITAAGTRFVAMESPTEENVWLIDRLTGSVYKCLATERGRALCDTEIATGSIGERGKKSAAP